MRAEGCLALLVVGGLACAQQARPYLFYCKYGKEAVRRATLSAADVYDAKGRLVKAKVSQRCLPRGAKGRMVEGKRAPWGAQWPRADAALAGHMAGGPRRRSRSLLLLSGLCDARR